MPRASSRHKSSKHNSSSNDAARDYSDSERDSSLKDSTRKPINSATTKVSKESEKRKLDLKESGNGEHVVLEEYSSSSSKRWREKIDHEHEHDIVNDRWNGEDDRFESSKKSSSRSLSESKSKKRDGIEADDVKKSSGKSRKEARESGGERERERKSKGTELVTKVTTESIVGLASENQLERRLKRRKSGSGEGGKQVEELDGRRLSSRDESERYKDKYRDDVDRDMKHRDHSNGNYKSETEIRQKKSKVSDNDHERDYERKHGREHDGYLGHRDGDRERARERERDSDYDWDWDRERERDRDRRVRDDERDRNLDIDREERSIRYKEKRKSPDDPSDYDDAKPPRGNKVHYPSDMEKKSSRAEPEIDRGRAQSRQPKVDTAVSSTRRRASPTSTSLDDFRQLQPDDTKYREPVVEQKHRGNNYSERGSKYRPAEKPARVDDSHLGDEKSSSKASPRALMEKSPSTSRYINRSGVRSGGAREKSTENRASPLEKPLLIDDSKNMDSSTTHGSRIGQNNPSLIHPPSYNREEDNRVNSNATPRYNKRDNEPNIRRGGQGTPWRGPPNWSPALPNSFMPFQHGGFQAMIPQFPSPLYGVRPPPSMDMNHPGLSYHFPDSDRYMRPLGWQGSAPSHLHGWDEQAHMYPDWDQNRQHPMHGRLEMWKGQNGDLGNDMLSKSQKEDDNSSVQYDNNNFGAKVVEANGTSSPKTTEEEVNLKSDDDRGCAYLSKLDISSQLAGKELYSQCMSLLEIEESSTVDQDNMVVVNLKDGGRAIPKRSIMLHSPSLLPSPNDAVFQRAMGHYMKQREEISSFRVLKSKIILSNEEDDTAEVAAPESEVIMMDEAEKLDLSINEETAEPNHEAIINEDSNVREPEIPGSSDAIMSTETKDGDSTDERNEAFIGEDTNPPHLNLSPDKASEPTNECELVIITNRIHDDDDSPEKSTH